MAGRSGRLRVGTSGWQYDHWRGAFYPQELPKREWFRFYSQSFGTVEVNNTFYNLPSAEVFDNWRRQAPRGFCYTLKFSRYGTHIKRLRQPRQTIELFLERAGRLGELLGPILVQLPPRWKPDVGRLAAFLEATPAGQRWAVEFRDGRWLCQEVYDLLSRHNAALCVHDLIEDHPRVVTADWVYLRFHGVHYGGSYSSQALTAVAREVKGHLEAGLDVYAYFNNDAEGYAVANAMSLRKYALDE